MIIFLFLTLSTSYLFYKIDAHNTIYNVIHRKYKAWKKINRLVSSHRESYTDIYAISFQMILQAMKQSCIQYLNDSVKKLDKNTYEVSYVIKGNLYKMLVIPKKGPAPILQIRNESNTDITEYILPYYGPCYDWHSVGVIPQFFKCKEMIFEMSNGDEKKFNELEYIDLN